jgi:hypothetical protein
MTTAFTDVDRANLMQGFGHLTGSHRRTLAAIVRPPPAHNAETQRHGIFGRRWPIRIDAD